MATREAAARAAAVKTVTVAGRMVKGVERTGMAVEPTGLIMCLVDEEGRMARAGATKAMAA